MPDNREILSFMLTQRKLIADARQTTGYNEFKRWESFPANRRVRHV